MAVIDKVRMALRVTTEDFDDEISDLIRASVYDLESAGVVVEDMDEFVLQAVKTYVKANFGNPDNYERLKKSYDEQKAQLSMRTGYTTWVEDEDE